MPGLRLCGPRGIRFGTRRRGACPCRSCPRPEPRAVCGGPGSWPASPMVFQLRLAGECPERTDNDVGVEPTTPRFPVLCSTSELVVGLVEPKGLEPLASRLPGRSTAELRPAYPAKHGTRTPQSGARQPGLGEPGHMASGGEPDRQENSGENIAPAIILAATAHRYRGDRWCWPPWRRIFHVWFTPELPASMSRCCGLGNVRAVAFRFGFYRLAG